MSRDPVWRQALRRAVVASHLGLAPALDVLGLSPGDTRVMDELISEADRLAGEV